MNNILGAGVLCCCFSPAAGKHAIACKVQDDMGGEGLWTAEIEVMFNRFAQYEGAFNGWRRDGMPGPKREFYK